jgi:hypothetical protein
MVKILQIRCAGHYSYYPAESRKAPIVVTESSGKRAWDL